MISTMSVIRGAAPTPIPLRTRAAAPAPPWRTAPERDALERLIGACLELVGDEGFERLAAVGLELAAGAARARGQAGRAARLAGAVAALSAGVGPTPVGLTPLPGGAPSAGASEPSAAARGRATRDKWGPLSAREREVAGLIAEGLTNRQIAEQLVISERTADTHVQNILSKLGLGCRAQVAAWVASRGLR